MKKILLLACTVFLSVTGYSQYYQLDWDVSMNPGGINEDNENPPGGGLPSGWTTIITGPSSAWSGDITLPFTFNFNGTDYTTCKVAPGFLTFGSPTTFPGITPSALPNAGIPDNTVAIWGLGIGSGDFIISKTFGSSPNRQFWVQMNTATNTNIQNGWAYWSIVLEEGTNKIYIVDQRNQCVTSTGQSCDGKTEVMAGIQIDGSTAITVSNSTIEGKAGASNRPIDNLYYTFYPGNQPDNDIMLISTDMKNDYELSGGAIAVKGRLRNGGATALTSYDLNYSINNGATVTQNITGVNIPSGDYATFEHSTPFVPTTSEAYSIKVWTSLPNQGTDGNEENDALTFDFRVHDKVYVKKPLYEVFTSSTCGPCNPGNTNFHNIIDPQEDECVYIKFQQSWPSTGDPYCTAESNERRTYYAVNSIPNMQIDGGWNSNANSFTQDLHDQATAEPAFMDIKATSVMWGKHVEVSVDIDPASDFTGNNTLHVAILEKVTYENIKTNGEDEFTHVMKKMMTGGVGVNLGTLTKDTKVTKQYTWDFKGDYTLPLNGQSANWINHNTTNSVEEFDDLIIAVWVQNASTKVVHQAAYATQENLSVLDMTAESKFTLYPNPATKTTSLDFELTQNSDVKVSVLNISGQEVATTNAGNLFAGKNTVDVDVSALSKGVYYVQLVTEFGTFTKPLTVN